MTAYRAGHADRMVLFLLVLVYADLVRDGSADTDAY